MSDTREPESPEPQPGELLRVITHELRQMGESTPAPHVAMAVVTLALPGMFATNSLRITDDGVALAATHHAPPALTEAFRCLLKQALGDETDKGVVVAIYRTGSHEAQVRTFKGTRVGSLTVTPGNGDVLAEQVFAS